ncbi:hypothetical protein K491DRAFT_760420 [Lophiostoma macrostomum CBS 122681]|uniref:Zn(2)-C6 fungal-type domain-containing protein n=1 Tax=Lophiostoma macrostomum CBS 122681 TaxID=1314788 RepID=A0A6A6SZF8_9PLEO|nr:hypothetical protein K491DRAFT_760420 [Lophiostoma macrostomum CBS 122681]
MESPAGTTRQPEYASPFFGCTEERGRFHSFDLRIETVHHENGYWLFHQPDEAEAWRLEYKKPEQILRDEIYRDGAPQNIQLRWIHGQLDSYQGQQTGNVWEHLREISREQKILGLPNLPYMELPTYPIDPEGRLLQHRQQKDGSLPPQDTADLASHEAAAFTPQQTSGFAPQETTGLLQQKTTGLLQQQTPSLLSQEFPGFLPQETPVRTYDKRPRCTRCSKAKKDCDRAHPNCGRCSQAGATCEYPSVEERRLNRNGVACTACRHERKFCDKVRPQCKRCSDHGRSCVYLDTQQGDNSQDIPTDSPDAEESTDLSRAVPEPFPHPGLGNLPSKPMHPFAASPSSFPSNSPFSSNASPSDNSSIPTVNTAYDSPDSWPSSLGLLSSRNKRPSAEYISPYSLLLHSPAHTAGNNIPLDTTGAEDGHLQNGRQNLEQAQQATQTDTSPGRESLEDPVVLIRPESPKHGPLAEPGDVSDYMDLPTAFGSFDMTRLMHEIEVDPNGISEIPCMDCGEMTGHRSDCHIGNIKPLNNLTMRQYSLIADAVESFDPEPWRENHHPPFQIPEDYATKVRGMAEVIRAERDYIREPRYHSMTDDQLVLFWGFKTMKDAQVIWFDGDEPYMLESESENDGEDQMGEEGDNMDRDNMDGDTKEDDNMKGVDENPTTDPMDVDET